MKYTTLEATAFLATSEQIVGLRRYQKEVSAHLIIAAPWPAHLIHIYWEESQEKMWGLRRSDRRIGAEKGCLISFTLNLPFPLFGPEMWIATLASEKKKKKLFETKKNATTYGATL